MISNDSNLLRLPIVTKRDSRKNSNCLQSFYYNFRFCICTYMFCIFMYLHHGLDLTKDCCESSSIPSTSTWTASDLNFEFGTLQMDLVNKCCETTRVPSTTEASSLDINFTFDSISFDIEKPCCESIMVPSSNAPTSLDLSLTFDSISLNIEKPCCESKRIPSSNQFSVSIIKFLNV